MSDGPPPTRVGEQPQIAAHRHSSNHRAEIERSTLSGCFHCLAIYAPETIKAWIDGDNTALCPSCRIDSVIGDASEFPVTEDFLRAMNAHWFRTRP